MNGALRLIEIERLVLRDPAFTAERGERIRLALSSELQRRMIHRPEDGDVSPNGVDVADITVHPSDDDETIARRLAQGILERAGLAQEADRG